MDALQAHPLTGTDDAIDPFWSPDSRNIGFFAQGKLKRIPADGGLSQTVFDIGRAAPTTGGSWGRDGTILFGGTLVAVSSIRDTGGQPADLTPRTGEQRQRPVVLPDGKHFLYLFRGGRAEDEGIHVRSLDGSDDRRLIADISQPVLAASSGDGGSAHILFVRENTLMALPFDTRRGTATGDAFPVAADVSSSGFDATRPPVSVSDTGVLVYGAGVATTSQLEWLDRTGSLLGKVGAAGEVYGPSLSPDGKRVAFRRPSENGRSALWIADLNRNTEIRVADGGTVNDYPAWSPTGDRIVFGSNRTGPVNLYTKAVNSGEDDEVLFSDPLQTFSTQWSADGRFIVFTKFEHAGDIWVRPMAGKSEDRKPFAFLSTDASERHGQLSPDSHWMAFASNRSGRFDVYVRPFPSGSGEWLVSTNGGEQPRWRADGQELFFVGLDGKMMAAAVKATSGRTAAFEADVPTALFDSNVALGRNALHYDVTPDGKRFLVRATRTAPSQPLTVVTSWTTASGKQQ